MIATGTRKASAYIQGINFNTDLKNQVHLLLGKSSHLRVTHILLFKMVMERLLQLLKKQNIQKDFLKTVQNILNQKILIFLKPKI